MARMKEIALMPPSQFCTKFLNSNVFIYCLLYSFKTAEICYGVEHLFLCKFVYQLARIKEMTLTSLDTSGKIIWTLVILKFSLGYPGLMRLARLVRLVRLPKAQQIPYSVVSQF